MNLLELSLVLTFINSFLGMILYMYLYKNVKQKYMAYWMIGWVTFTIRIILKIIYFNKETIFVNYTSTILSFVSIFIISIGMYKFVNRKMSIHFKIFFCLSILFLILAFVINSGDRLQTFVALLAGYTLIWTGINIFRYFTFTNLGKYTTGLSFILLGLHQFDYPIFVKSDVLLSIGYIANSVLLLLMIIGFLISYYEKTRFDLIISDKKLEESEESYKLAVEGSNDGIWDWNIISDEARLSKKCLETFSDYDGNISNFYESWKSLIHPKDLDNVIQKLNNHKKGITPYFICEYRMKNLNDNYVWVLSRGQVIRDSNNNPIRMVGSNTDVSERKENEQKIYNLAYYDQITKLPNKFYFIEHVNKCLKKAKKATVIFVNVDNFKNINDALGYGNGDSYLKEVGNNMKKYLSKSQIISRYNGDEFAIFLPNISDKDIIIQNYIENIISVFKKPYTINNREFILSASIGISIYPQNGDNIEILVKNASTAVSKIKENGKNNYLFFEEKFKDKLLEKLDMEKNLRVAIKYNDFIIHYQPQIDTQTKEMVGMEALIRWKHNDKMISPLQFIPLAEETGLIVPIGEWVLRTACKQNKTLQNSGFKKICVSVNVSTIQLKHDNFLETLKSVLEETKLEPQYLKLEITESILMESLDYSIDILNEIKKLGVKIALDDFGTGYSSLNYLKQLPIDTVKIDKSFIKDINKSEKENLIIDATIELANKMGLYVITEGVETKEQVEFLEKGNCDCIQGYYFSKPVEFQFIKDMLNKEDTLYYTKMALQN